MKIIYDNNLTELTLHWDDGAEAAKTDDTTQKDGGEMADGEDASPCYEGRKRILSGRSSSVAFAATPFLYGPARGMNVHGVRGSLTWLGFPVVSCALTLVCAS